MLALNDDDDDVDDDYDEKRRRNHRLFKVTESLPFLSRNTESWAIHF